MKIAFLGSHGVGKTTLCFDLAARLKRLDLNVDIVREVARSCPLPINRETTLNAQAWILLTQITQEIAASHQFTAVICDRSVLDNYAYLVHRLGRRAEFDALVGNWVKTYTGLFKVPVVQAPAYDGTRDLSVRFQREIDEIIDDLLDGFGLGCVRLDASDRDGWIDRVMSGIGLPGSTPQFDLFDRG